MGRRTKIAALEGGTILGALPLHYGPSPFHHSTSDRTPAEPAPPVRSRSCRGVRLCAIMKVVYMPDPVPMSDPAAPDRAELDRASVDRVTELRRRHAIA